MFWRFAIPTLAAFAALTASPTVRAADMPLPPPAAAEPCCNWYLRGFVGEGMTNKFSIRISAGIRLNASNGFAFDQNSNADTFFIGGGIGYNFNSWLRFDGTRRISRPDPGQRARSLYHRTAALSGDTYQGQSKILGVPGQRLCRSRHLELFHAVCRRRHRRRIQSIGSISSDMGLGTAGAGFGRNSANGSIA